MRAFFKHELPSISTNCPLIFLAFAVPRFLVIYTAKAVRFLLNLEKATTLSRLKIEFHADQTMSDSLKIEFHADQTMSDSLKIEFHADQTMSDSLKIEFHAKQLRYHSEKIELSLLEGMFAHFASCVYSQEVVCYSFIIIK